MKPSSRSETIVAVVGPTGSGKSALALQLAERLGGEVVSCDALQVYRGLDIGTAKLAALDRRGVPHHLIDVADPREEFSAADYLRLAVRAIESIVERGRVPLIVGGTGLYLRVLRKGLFSGPGRCPEIRRRLDALSARRGDGRLHRLLERLDPESARRIHPKDRVRVVRALEVRLSSGRPMSEMMRERVSPLADFHVILVGLAPSRDCLVARIEERVQDMIDQGFENEVRTLKRRCGDALPAYKAIGYREMLRYIDGEIDLGTAKALITRATVQYAKRQMTWFRREEGISWLHGHGGEAEVSRAALRRLAAAFPDRSLETVHAETAS